MTRLLHMPPVGPEQEFLSEFKRVVAKDAARRVVREYVIAGPCRTMSEPAYYALRSEVADRWHMHPNEIVVVGSGKLGFSISPKKRYALFNAGSDYDIAIIGSDLFDYFWRLAFRFTGSYYAWKQRDRFLRLPNPWMDAS